jgi:type VI secretion system secreted protein VgrG
MSETAQDIASASWVEVSFAPDPGYKLIFDGVHAREELGRPFEIDIDLSSGTLQDVSKLIGASATLWLAQSKEGVDDRYFNGYVTRAVSSGKVGGAYRYHIEVRPWISLLKRVTDCSIFQNMSPFDIITKVFRDAGFTDFEDRRQASAGDTTLEYCVQYRETSFDFVTRLMEEYGLYYFFEHEDGKHTLVLADDPSSHTALTPAIPFVFDQTEYRTVGDHIWEWAAELVLESGKVTMRDYNFTTPSADLTARSVKSGSHPYGSLELYDFPGGYDVTDTGTKLTDVRLQATVKHRSVAKIASNARGLHAGKKFTLSNHPDSSVNTDYLVMRSEFEMSIAEGSSTTEGETLDTYRVKCQVIPGTTNFRLDQWTPRPMIRGPQTAVVVGTSGEEIDPDQYGRVKVKFFWDRSDTTGEDCSCWIRVVQSIAGAGWGSIFIPRIGQEVVVEFLEGNPDRPLITGVVYNATNTVPYALPDNKTRTTFKSNSSAGGGGFNELRFEDKAGSEEVFFQAQKDYHKVVLNNETIEITKDTTATVKEGNRSVTVSQGNDTTTVSQGNHTTTVSAGNHKLDVSAGTSEITAAQSITLTVGSNSIKIDTSGVTINGIKIAATASAQMSLDGGAQLSATAGMISLN